MNQIRVEIVSAEVTERSGEKAQGDGTKKPWRMRTQKAYLHTGKPYPEEFELQLKSVRAGDPASRDVPGYAPGFYELAPSSLIVDDKRLRVAFDVELVKSDKPAALKAA